MYPKSSLILLMGDPGISRLAIVQLVSEEMGMACIQVCMDQINNRYSGDKEAMRERYLKLAEEASEDKDVILYFADSQLALMRTMSDQSTKITLVGAANSTENLDNNFLGKISKYISIPPPNLKARLNFINMQIEVAHFSNDIGEKEMEFIGRETEKFSFRDLQRLWYQSCDILLSHIRKADHFKNTNKDDFRCFVPCNCNGECERFEKKNVISDAIEMRVSGETIIKALSAVSIVVHNKIIKEDEYLQKFSNFIQNKEDISQHEEENEANKNDDDDDDFCLVICGCMTILITFVIGIIILILA